MAARPDCSSIGWQRAAEIAALIHWVCWIIASDVTLAKQIPADADEGKATDYLFREGYAEWPSGALALFRNLTAAYTDIADVIGETGIIPAEFAEAVNALPYLPRCTLPNMGRTLSAVS
jgi:hypothetical protein